MSEFESQKQLTREQMIDRLVDYQRTLALEIVTAYENRILKMSDEQIKKEFRMEFEK